MELGEKLRQARLEAGLSQRQLCDGIITRNMLSLIEHGTANPSMDTLKLLAARLEKSVSFFLEEDALVSPNQRVMEDARNRFDAGDPGGALSALENYRQPDPVYDREKILLENLSLLAAAEHALEAGRRPYALELLKKAGLPCPYCGAELQRRRLLLLGRLSGQPVASRLPSLDSELLLRAEEAFRSGAAKRAAQLLEATEDQTRPEWNLLRGQVWLEESAFRKAAQCLHRAENAFPKETAPLLERCYRELEDYKRAYEYACRRR